MINNGTLIVGVDEAEGENGNLFRIVLYNYNTDTGEWKFNKTVVSERQLISAALAGKVKLANTNIDYNGKIRWDFGAVTRFTASAKYGVNPLVIISEIRPAGEKYRILGYKVATYDGKVRNVKLTDLLGYCTRISSEAAAKSIPIVPIQNAIFIPAANNKEAYIKSYKENQFEKEYIKITRPVNAEPAKINNSENTRQISKLNELFTDDQIKELKLGKKNGVNIKIYGNNQLSAAQMREIRIALENGLDPRPYADPAFKPEIIKAYRIQSKYGVNISEFINPRYDKEQIFELSTAWLSGVNLAKLADPDKPANTMAKERIEMETQLWNEVDIKEKKDI